MNEESPYKDWHTERLIAESRKINAEISARLQTTLFALSAGFFDEEHKRILLEILRGSKEK